MSGNPLEDLGVEMFTPEWWRHLRLCDQIGCRPLSTPDLTMPIICSSQKSALECAETLVNFAARHHVTLLVQTATMPFLKNPRIGHVEVQPWDYPQELADRMLAFEVEVRRE